MRIQKCCLGLDGKFKNPFKMNHQNHINQKANLSTLQTDVFVKTASSVAFGSLDKSNIDTQYKKTLAVEAGLSVQNANKLKSIVGPDEYVKILETLQNSPVNYSPGQSLRTDKKDGFDLSGVEKKSLRANLHMHTIHSDGQMSVKELLDKAAEYADSVAEKLSKEEKPMLKEAPYTIAITDHDTVEGAKEVPKILASDPEKYKNLRVVLGVELSVENNALDDMTRPIDTHMLLHAINPFDKKLNSMLDRLKDEREDIVKDLLGKGKSQLVHKYPQTAEKLSFEDAVKVHPILKNRLTHLYNATKDYMQFSTIFSECVEQNPWVKEQLSVKGKELKEYNEPLNERFFKAGSYNPYWKKYEKAVQLYLSNTLGIPENAVAKKVFVPDEMQDTLKKLEGTAYSAMPSLSLGKGYLGIKEALSALKEQEYGYAGIAHPAYINMASYIKNPDRSIDSMYKMFERFKQMGNEKALFAEVHYPYDSYLANADEWHNYIEKFAKLNGLLFSGGIDNHGKSIFYEKR